MRPRKKQRSLPQCMYHKHGKYYLVKANKWMQLGDTLEQALLAYVRYQNPDRLMMPELINKALAHMTANAKYNTVKQYNSSAKALCEIFSEFEPSQVTSRHIAAIKQEYTDRPTAANQLITFAKNVFAYAIEWGIVDNNPAVGIRRYKESARTRYITDTELHTILNSAAEPLKSIVTLCFYTGQRISDVLNIKNSDITDEGINFVQQKTGQRLVVQFNNELEAVIKNHTSNSEYLLTTQKGEPHKYDTIKTQWAKLMKRLNIENCHIHDLRAKALTDAKKQGKNAQALGGHSTESMTNRYIRSRSTVVAEAPSIRQN